MRPVVMIACALLALAGCEKAEEVESDRPPPGPTRLAPDDAAEPTAEAVELTADDITRFRDLGSRRISVAGVTLGASRAEAERIIEADPRLSIHPDRANPERFYVKLAGTETSVFYFMWNPQGPAGLNRVTVFVDAADLLVGRTRDLLTLQALDPGSEVRREFLGEPAGERVSLDVPSIGLRHLSYVYPDLGLEVTDKHSQDGRQVVFALLAQP